MGCDGMLGLPREREAACRGETARLHDTVPALPRQLCSGPPQCEVSQQGSSGSPSAVGHILERTTRSEVHASLRNSTAEMIVSMFDRAIARGPERRSRWVLPADGANHRLDCPRSEISARGIRVGIIPTLLFMLPRTYGRQPRTSTPPAPPAQPVSPTWLAPSRGNTAPASPPASSRAAAAA